MGNIYQNTTSIMRNAILVCSLFLINSVLIQAATPKSSAVTADFTLSSTTDCIGANVTFTDASVGSNMVTWMWSFGSGASIASFVGQVPPTITYASAGVKSVTLIVLDNNNIPSSVTKTITINGAVADAGADKNFCANSSPGVQLGAASISGASYGWIPSADLTSASTSNPLASPTATTTYTVLVSLNGCTTTDQVVVTVLSPATANAGVDANICSTSSATIGSSAISGYTYSWIPTSGLVGATTSNPIASPFVNTVYTVIATAPNGCSATDQVAVNNIGVVNAIVGLPKTICNGSSTTIGGGAIVNYTYTWFPSTGLSSVNVANPTANPAATTKYYLLVSAAGCTDLDSVTVTVNNLPTAVIGANDTINTCQGLVNIIGGATISGYTYLWSPATFLSATNQAMVGTTPTSSITYTLTVTDVNNCTASNQIFVNVYTPVKAFAGLDQYVCFGNTIALGGTSVIATGGSGNFNYSWSPTATIISNPNTAHPNTLPLGTTTYYLHVVDAAGSNCGTDDDSVVVFINPLPHPVITMKSIYCTGDLPDTLIASPAGGIFSGVGVIDNKFYPGNVAVTPGTPYTVTYTYTSPSGCTYDTAESVIVFQTPTANAGVDASVCPATGFPTTQLIASGGTSYSWTPATTLNNAAIYNPMASPTSTTSYIVGVTLNACTAFDTVVVTICNAVAPAVYAADDWSSTHIGTSVLVPVLNNDTSSININDHSVISILTAPNHGTATANNGSTPSVNYTPNAGFIGYDTLTYIVCDSLINQPYCDTAKVFITIRPKAVIEIVGTHSNPLPCGATITNVVANDQIGVGYAITIRVIVVPVHGVSTVNGNYITYNPFDGFVGDDELTYELTVNGLKDTAKVSYYVKCETCDITTGVSPNNDGDNDFFVIGCIDNYPNNELKIYNRWGNEIYSRHNYQNDWNGRYNDQDLPDGTYFYLLKYNDGVTPDKTGFVVLHR